MSILLPKKEKAWQSKTIPHITDGIDTSKRSDVLGDSQCITLNNVRLIKQQVLVDTGYALFGQAISGYPQRSFRFTKKSGTSENILITTGSLYKYNSTHSKWHLIKGTAGTTTTASAAAGATTIAVTSASGFASTELVGITLDNGDQHQTTISVSGLTFTLTDAIPVGRSVASGASVIRAVVLAGTRDDSVDADTVASHDWFVFTNGVNIVQRYDGTDCVVVPNLPSAGNTICKSVAVYNSALFLLNTTEGGTAYPQRVRRSDQSDPTNWTTGTSGYDDLYDSSDTILAGWPLGPYLIVYRSLSITRGQFIGSGGINYQFNTVVSGDGAIAAGGIVDIGEYHIVVGNNNVYEYRGGFDTKPIGDALVNRLFSTRGNLSPQYKSKLFAFHMKQMNEVCIVYPDTGSTYPNKALRYSIDTKAWYERSFAHTFTGYGPFLAVASFSWNDLVGSWLDQVWQWNSSSMVTQADTILLCSAESSQVYEYDYVSTLDNTTAIQYTVETKDFVLTDSEFRLDTVTLYMQGTSVLLEYSVDQGLSWNTLSTITQPTMGKVLIGKQLVANTIRFRLSGTSPDFKLSWIYISFKIESLYLY